MGKLKKTFALVLYYGLASHLPNYSFPGGKLFNAFRVACLRGVIPVGRGCRIMRGVYVGNGNDISIGNFCRINEKVRLDNVRIGDHVMIARESIVLGKMHEFGSIDIPMEQQGERETGPVVIENDVWLGLRVIILPGVYLRRGSIIAAGAVVTKSTDELGIYGGVPAQLIKKRQSHA